MGSELTSPNIAVLHPCWSYNLLDQVGGWPLRRIVIRGARSGMSLL